MFRLSSNKFNDVSNGVHDLALANKQTIGQKSFLNWTAQIELNQFDSKCPTELNVNNVDLIRGTWRIVFEMKCDVYE